MSTTSDELAILGQIFAREAPAIASSSSSASTGGTALANGGADGGSGGGGGGFNVLVDLCGLVKKTSIHAIKDLVLKHFGRDTFHYLYARPAAGRPRQLAISRTLAISEILPHRCKLCPCASSLVI